MNTEIRAAAIRVILRDSDVEIVAPDVICIALKAGTGVIGAEDSNASPPPQELLEEVVEVLGDHDPPFLPQHRCEGYSAGVRTDTTVGQAVFINLWEPSFASSDSLVFAASYVAGPLHGRGKHCVVRAEDPLEPRCSGTWIS